MTILGDVEKKWSNLDPIFIMGMQRSGTSIMAIALTLPGFTSFGEGHLWFELLEPLARFRNAEYRSVLKQDVFALGEGRNLLLEKYIALAIDRFHRDNLPEKPTRWVDKSPGVYPVKIAPMLARVFPKSQFIFMCRNGITTVNSGLHLWPNNPGIFQTMCTGWVDTMSAWRRVRGMLENRYIEICQEEMARNPMKTSSRLAGFLGVSEHRMGIAKLLDSHRANTAFPNKPPGDYRYEIDWSDEQKMFFVRTCASEMKAWGYSIPSSVNVGISGRWKRAWHLLRSGKLDKLCSEANRYLAWRLKR